MWRSVLCVSVVCTLALDSNNIRSSNEATLPSSEPPRGGCSNRAQRKASSAVDRQRDRDVDRQTDSVGVNRTKAQVTWGCVRSRDCGAGHCCARYLKTKRCQRVPVEGEACQLQGSKRRRNLGRCDCDAGLSCTAVNPAEPGKQKHQGVCVQRPGPARRTSRHSGKKRTAARSC
ncbi:dickkopf-related protein 4-like [Melanotaenia boesemani]|uniref:dickkopf-related protein 4-like n=1 Tax=Melanotaenia boesemani TaxID=1250792 RepID=UPI001C04CA11|nr:dickkopf-related protein 4-like [Melanotaenia boesemani]